MRRTFNHPPDPARQAGRAAWRTEKQASSTRDVCSQVLRISTLADPHDGVRRVFDGVFGVWNAELAGAGVGAVGTAMGGELSGTMQR